MDAAAIIVIDGESVRAGADGERIKLRGYGAPRPRNAGCPEEEALAQRTVARLRTLVASGKAKLHTDNRRDVYGHLVGTIMIDGKDVGAVLIAEGLAKPWSGRGPRPTWCAR